MKNQLTKLKERMKNQKGFTLIELMAVIAILAMIVLIAVPAVGSILEKAKEGSFEAHIAMIENAGELAFVGGLAPDEGLEGADEDDIVYLPQTLIDNGYLNVDMAKSDAEFSEFYDRGQMRVVKQENGTFNVEFYVFRN